MMACRKEVNWSFPASMSTQNSSQHLPAAWMQRLLQCVTTAAAILYSGVEALTALTSLSEVRVLYLTVAARLL